MKIYSQEHNTLLWEQGRYDELYTETLQFMKWKMRYAYKVGIPEDDIQELMDLAFVKTIQQYNPEKGQFTTALGWSLIGEMRDYNRIKDRNNSNIIYYNSFEEDDLATDNMDFVESQALSFTLSSPVEEEVCEKNLVALVNKALSSLTEEEKDMIIRNYVLNQSQAEIAKAYNTYGTKVGRVLKRALSKMQEALPQEEVRHFICITSSTTPQKDSKQICYELLELGLNNQSIMDRTGLAFETVKRYRTKYNKEMGKEPSRGRKHKVC